MTTLCREDLVRALPYARRYARALTGSQPLGDGLVSDVLRGMATEELPERDARHSFYARITQQFAPSAGAADGIGIVPRQLLLLTSLEDVPIDDAAAIVGVPASEAAGLLAEARTRLRAAAATDVLIIEDEPIIAMDIEELVESCGHRVVGVAATEVDAVRMAEASRPGLILADINLGAGGNGSSAVARIMRHHYAPVIFVTAYPERLLTGEAFEPAFVITKPFEPLTLAIATYQAVSSEVRLD
jgi:CheY-like chemotaxis protein